MQDLFAEFHGWVYVGICFLATVLGLTGRTLSGLVLLAAVFFYRNIAVEFVSALEIWKAVAIICTVLAVTGSLDRRHRIRLAGKFPPQLVGLGIYLAATTMLGLLPILTGATPAFYEGFTNNTGRIFTQAVYYGIVATLLFLPIVSIRRLVDLEVVLNAAYSGVLLLAILALVQWSVFETTGYNMFPINRVATLDYDSLFINSGGVFDVFRANSLAGEPKHLGIAMSMGLALHVSAWATGYKLRFANGVSLAVFITAVLLTYSTTGLVMAGAVLGLGGLKWARRSPKFVAVCALAIGVAAPYVMNRFEMPIVYEMVIQKTGLEEQDRAVLAALMEHPVNAVFGFGAGNVHHYAVQYVDPVYFFFRDRAFKGNSGALFVIADVGLVGMALFLAVFYVALRNLGRRARSLPPHERSLAACLQLFAGILLTIFLMRYMEFIFLVLGMVIAATHQLRPVPVEQPRLAPVREAA